MKWYKSTLFERIQVGLDDTRNPIYALEECEKPCLVRTAPWAARHIDNDGNNFDVIERTFLTKCTAVDFTKVAAIVVCGEHYTVERVSYGEAIALTVKRCKPWESR